MASQTVSGNQIVDAEYWWRHHKLPAPYDRTGKPAKAAKKSSKQKKSRKR